MMTSHKLGLCSNSSNKGLNSEEIPFDIAIQILLKLPAKSIARFRCLSKRWDSTILNSPCFTESFFTISSFRPKLLFTCQLDGKRFFFTSPQQPQDSCPLTASFHMSFPIDCPSDICRPVRGLVYGTTQWNFLEAQENGVPLVCNPSTGQFLTLPKVEKKKSMYAMHNWLGYDPVDKQFKVLCMIWNPDFPLVLEHEILTLGTGKELSWRMIKSDILYYAIDRGYNGSGDSVSDGICIDGVLYYLASVYDHENYGFGDIVCFDVRSEEFSYIKVAQGMNIPLRLRLRLNVNATLVNYKGKLAMLQLNHSDRGSIQIQLWVLEDAKKHQWSSYTYNLPRPLRKILSCTKLSFVGITTNTGDIILSPDCVTDAFYIFYYNPERNSFTRVEIQGMEAYSTCRPFIFLDHVEDVKLMTSI